MDSLEPVLIFFNVGSRHETAFFYPNTPDEQIKGTYAGHVLCGPLRTSQAQNETPFIVLKPFGFEDMMLASS